MKTKITQLSKLTIALIVLFFMNLSVNAQDDGDFEFLFDEDDELEGWIDFNNADLPITVADGYLTYTFGSATAGFELNPPADEISIDLDNYPLLAIKFSAIPTLRQYMYCSIDGVKGWYGNKANPIIEEVDLFDENVVFYDFSTATFGADLTLESGIIERLIFNLQTDTGDETVEIDWIKTFASVEDIQDYLFPEEPVGFEDVANKLQTKIMSRDNEIYIQKCELNAKVEVFDISGRFVTSTIASSNEVSIACNKGIYIVKVSGTSTIRGKAVIR